MLSSSPVPTALSDPLLNDAETGTSASLQPKHGSRSLRPSAEETTSRGRWKLALYGLAALSCGILIFNFHYIVQVSHIHLSLSTSHRTSAFCAYAGCSDAATPTEAAKYHAPPEVVAALSSRVCGSPAVDGYAHVVPKCFVESPTAVWWHAYYAAGGNQGDLVVHIEEQADYDGLAVFWGINNKKANAEECAAHCSRHMPNMAGDAIARLPCNAFGFCPFDTCFEPDAHKHSKGDCWLKFTEGPASPEVNMRGALPASYRSRHPNAPNATHWISGVLLPRGVDLTNGTWSPRWSW